MNGGVDPDWVRAGANATTRRDQARRYARVLLKQWTIPDRLCSGPDGEPVLEVLDGFTWRPFDFDPPGVEPGLP
jgi:hypothetical protein